MVAFLDTEFLTSQVKGGPPAKLVSVGFVVCGKDFEEVTRFHSYIYAEDKLHDRFQEMTGIEEEDLFGPFRCILAVFQKISLYHVLIRSPYIDP